MKKILQNKILPQNIEAEQAVLSSVFLDNDMIEKIIEYIQPNDFYEKKHKIIFEKMLYLNEKNENIDIITMKNILEKEKLIKKIGGIDYISYLNFVIPTTSNIIDYIKIIENKSILRKLIKVSIEIIEKSFNNKEEIEKILDFSENKINEISEKRNNNELILISEILNNTINNIDNLKNNKKIGLSTGYEKIDEMIFGLQEEELIILAARPSVGKTALALNIIRNISCLYNNNENKGAIAIFSLEMGIESLVNRFLCIEGSINFSNLRTGNLTENEWKNLIIAIERLSKTSIYIDDTSDIKISDIKIKCKKLLKEHKKLDLILIDYIQLIEGSNKENRQQEVSEISRQLKKLAKELKVPILAISQLSRNVEQRQNKRPILSDIRESGSIEQDADIVMFLYSEKYYNKIENFDNKSEEIIEILIEKNRNGACGKTELIFLKQFNKFVNKE